ncbi:hypothetical protein KAJ27_12725 [bacterium]|nr:hypothetical protein [bacterium]
MQKKDIEVGYYRVNNLLDVNAKELVPMFHDKNGAMVYRNDEECLIFSFAESDVDSKHYVCEIEINNVVVNLLIPEKKTCFKILVLDDEEIHVTNVIADLNAEYLHRLQLVKMNLPIYLEFYIYSGMKIFPKAQGSLIGTNIYQ